MNCNECTYNGVSDVCRVCAQNEREREREARRQAQKRAERERGYDLYALTRIEARKHSADDWVEFIDSKGRLRYAYDPQRKLGLTV